MAKYTVTEQCPHCGEEITIKNWDFEKGLEARCPRCKKPMMLCGECPATTNVGTFPCAVHSGESKTNCAAKLVRPAVWRDVPEIPNHQRVEQEDGSVCYFFGDTTIRTSERHTDAGLRLSPVSGDQIAHGSWEDLEDWEVRAYCTLLEEYINLTEGSQEDG